MPEIHTPNILKYTGSLVTEYPIIDELVDAQLKIFWLPDEPKVEKDIQDVLVNMTPAEKHGLLTVLKLFTHYELAAGAEYWGGRFKNTFKKVEFQRMGLTFGMVELAIHKSFYQKINELLNSHNNEFYNDYVRNPILSNRMEYISKIIEGKSDLLSLAGFSFVEGVILYGNFGYIKHFQSQGKNKVLNIVRGINFTVRDENLHAIAGATIFKLLKKELKLSKPEENKLKDKIFDIANICYLHECEIIDMIFSEGEVEGTSPQELKIFIQSRINMCLYELGYEDLFEVLVNPIAEWFYTGINGFSLNDNFTGIGNQYHRNWSEDDFVYDTYVKI